MVPNDDALPAPSGLTWGLKASFVSYVASSGGDILASRGAAVSTQGAASWPLADDAGFDRDTGDGVLDFGGSVRYLAHFGALDLDLDSPRLEVAGREAVLTIARADAARLTLATFHVERPAPVPGHSLLVGAAGTLADDAAYLFGGVYGPGTTLDPLIVALAD